MGKGLSPKDSDQAAPAKPRSARRRSREYAMQGVYEWLLNHSDLGVVQAHIMESDGFSKADADHFESLLGGAIRNAELLREQFADLIDRPVIELSPVEHAVLLVAAYELRQHAEIPYRVVINEAVEITKSFGGTDGFKYVNGVLDRLATRLRPNEPKADTRNKSS